MISCRNLLLTVLFVSSTTIAVYGQQEMSLTCTSTATCPKENCIPATHSDDDNSTDPPQTNGLEEMINETRANTRAIDHLKKDLCDLKKNILSLPKDIVALLNDTTSTRLPLPTSCKDIKQRIPSSPSGVYLIAATAKTTEYVYCNMETLCGSDEGWTRLVHIDMTNSSESCPSGLRLYQANGKRACGRPTSGGASCQSVKYPSHEVQYSRVCGKAIGYQYASPDAVDSTDASEASTATVTAQHNDINSYYVDGISLTRGSPRQHIWTLMAGYKEDNSYSPHGERYTCPCQTGSIQGNNIPSFIGDDYYCESGNPALPPYNQFTLYTADPLWDGKQCRGLESPCCVPGLPWFNKQLGTTTSDYIEVRVCSDQGTGNEDTTIEQLEIYVN